ncbi:MAG: hypothetical protein M1836_002676 [Candelina mexicana]|nr:MAG: hypothetical protein M1836_002676 [Candelina mexicana]
MDEVQTSKTILSIEAHYDDLIGLPHNARFRSPIVAQNTTSSSISSCKSAGRTVREVTPAVKLNDSYLYITFDDSHMPNDPVSGWIFGSDEETCDVLLSVNVNKGVSRRHFSINFHPESKVLLFKSLSRNGTKLTSDNIGFRVKVPMGQTQLLASQTIIFAGQIQLNISFPARNDTEQSEYNRLLSQRVSEAKEATPKLAGFQIDCPEITPHLNSPPTARKRIKLPNMPKYVYGKRLGQGSFGEVFEAFHQTSGDRFAAKRFFDPNDAMKVEVAMLQKANHQHIVRFIETDFDHADPMMIMELVEGGTLDNLGSLDADVTTSLTQQMLSALGFLHSISITHRDVKPSNILLSQKWNFKLTDFGISKDGSPLKTCCGSREYMAPEVYPGCSGYTATVDLWSLGVVIMEVHLDWGLPVLPKPYEHKDWLRAVSRQSSKMKWSTAPLCDVVRTMLKPEASSRSSAAALLEQLQQTTSQRQPQSSNDSLLNCPLPRCRWVTVSPDDYTNHIIRDHNYRKAYLSSHPLVHSFPSKQLINATELCRISDIPRSKVKAKLDELHIEYFPLRHGGGGSYITYDNGCRLCEAIDLDASSVYCAGEPRGERYGWGQVYITHGQLFVHRKIVSPKNLDTGVPEQLPRSKPPEIREPSGAAADIIDWEEFDRLFPMQSGYAFQL